MNISQSLVRPALRVSRCALLLGISLSSPIIAGAQNPNGAGVEVASLPDSPQPQQQDASSATKGTTSKFVGYVSNKSFFFPDLATSPGPLSTGEKFKLFVNQSISPPYLLAAGLSAALSQARDVPSGYGQGWGAFGGRYGATLARASSDSFFGSFVFASALHQDPRFFPQYRPSFWDSTKYSARRLFVTRTDSGREQLDISGLLGPLAAEGLANAYLPRSEQTAAQTAERYGIDLAWKFAGNMFKNYWPTIFRSMGLNRLKVIPEPAAVGDVNR
jgi:hypothetical protein